MLKDQETGTVDINAPEGAAVVQKEKSARAKIQMYMQRFRDSEQAYSGLKAKWRLIDLFDRAEQYTQTSLPPWIPKPVTNYVRYIRTLKRANLASAIPMAHYSAEYEEDSETVDRLQKAYKHVWEKRKVERTVRRCIDLAVKNGTSIVYVYDSGDINGKYDGSGDKKKNFLFQGDVCVERIPVENFFPDRDAYEIDKCKFVTVPSPVTLNQVLNNPEFIKYAGKARMQTLKTRSHLVTSDETNGDIYDRDNKISNGQASIAGDEMVTLYKHFERYMDAKGFWRIDVSYYLENTDFFLYRQESIKPGRIYPFAVLYDEEEEKSFFGSSTVMDFMENQKVINRTSQAAAIITTLYQNPQKIVSRESGINAQEMARTGTLPGKVWVSNGSPRDAVTNIEPPRVSRELFEVEDRMKQDIREMSGVNEAYTGQSVGSLTTSTGVNSLIERATIRDKDKMVQIDAFVERISDLIVLHILYTWKDKRPISYKGPNGKPVRDTYEPISEVDADNLDWRVRSDMYATAPTTQALRRQQADQLMQMQGQFQYNPPLITPEEWIRFQDFDMKDEIMRRMEKDRALLEQQRPQQMAQMAMQVAQVLMQETAKGVPAQEAANTAMQMAQQMFAQQEQQSLQQGQESSAPAQAQAPQGTTGQAAMMAMAKGM